MRNRWPNLSVAMDSLRPRNPGLNFSFREEPAVGRMHIRPSSVSQRTLSVHPPGQEFSYGAGGIAHLRVVDHRAPASPTFAHEGDSHDQAIAALFSATLPFTSEAHSPLAAPEILGGHWPGTFIKTTLHGIETSPSRKPSRPCAIGVRRCRWFASRHQEGITGRRASGHDITDLRRSGLAGRDITTIQDRPGPDAGGAPPPRAVILLGSQSAWSA